MISLIIFLLIFIKHPLVFSTYLQTLPMIRCFLVAILHLPLLINLWFSCFINSNLNSNSTQLIQKLTILPPKKYTPSIFKELTFLHNWLLMIKNFLSSVCHKPSNRLQFTTLMINNLSLELMKNLCTFIWHLLFLTSFLTDSFFLSKKIMLEIMSTTYRFVRFQNLQVY